MFYDLLVPIDLDDPEVAKRVLEVARGLAKSSSVSLSLVNVDMDAASYAGSGAEENQPDTRRRVEDFLAGHGGLGDIKGIVHVDGSLFQVIRSAAAALGIDLVLLGSRDPSFTHRLLGTGTGESLSFGDLRVDLSAKRVFRNGHEVKLGPTEFRVLDCLLRHPGRVFAREELLGVVWGSDGGIGERTVDVHVARLRKALNHASGTDPIRTVRSVGYSWDPEFGR